MTPDPWLEAHAYLRPARRLCQRRSIARRPGSRSSRRRVPDWDDYRADFLAGVTAAAERRCRASISSRAAEWRPRCIETLARSHRLDGSRPRRAPSTRNCSASLTPRAALSTFCWATRALAPSFPGLLRYLGWTAMARFLASGRARLRQLARRGAVASQVLPDLRIVAGDGATRRRRTRAPASAVVRLLRHALAVQAHRLPVL